MNDLFEPFDDVDGRWHWVEAEWTIANDYTKYSRNVRQKSYSRVAIFERDYGCTNYIQEQVIEYLRKFIWHAKFFNSQEQVQSYADEYYGSDVSDSDDLDTKTVRTRSLIESQKNRPKSKGSVLSAVSKNISDDNPMSNPRCIPHKIFLSQLHNLARKMYEYNENQDMLLRKSMMNVDFQFSKGTQRAMNQEMEDLDTPVLSNNDTKEDNNGIGNPTKSGMTPLNDSDTDNTTTNKQDETPTMKVTVTGTKGNASSSGTGGMAEEHVGLNKVINNEAGKDHSPFGLLGVDGGSRANSLDGMIVIVVILILLLSLLLLFSVVLCFVCVAWILELDLECLFYLCYCFLVYPCAEWSALLLVLQAVELVMIGLPFVLSVSALSFVLHVFVRVSFACLCGTCT